MIDHLCSTMLLSIRLFFIITTTYLSLSFGKIVSDKMSEKLKGGFNEEMVLQAEELSPANQQREGVGNHAEREGKKNQNGEKQ